ncbi:MAG TPA: glycosyltransferase [Puia sp.]|nr:glycosyltransferase [Puia sp.]
MTQDTQKKKIVWVTPDSFIDSDFNPSLFSLLLSMYEIRWIIILKTNGCFYKESDFENFRKLKGLEIEFIYSSYRQRDPRRLLFYASLYKKINKKSYDLLYTSQGPAEPYSLPFFWSLNKNKTIYAVHEGHVNDNFKLPFLSRLLLKSVYPFAKFAQLFSPFAANIFLEHYPKAKIFMIRLALKPFGQSKLKRSTENIIFLSFGNINHAKNIDLLIEAACNIYEQGHKGFKVSINGSCDNWDFYQSKIRYPEIFICDIRKIENAEIPDLFCKSHYLVQPYRSTSQSGVLKIALNYNLPVIASDLPGFRQDIEEGVNGYFFKQGDVKDLEKILIKVLNEHHKNYESLLTKMEKETFSNYSPDKLNTQFAKMFADVLHEIKN